jgi:hypothetical protein
VKVRYSVYPAIFRAEQNALIKVDFIAGRPVVVSDRARLITL